MQNLALFYIIQGGWLLQLGPFVRISIEHSATECGTVKPQLCV